MDEVISCNDAYIVISLTKLTNSKKAVVVRMCDEGLINVTDTGLID